MSIMSPSTNETSAIVSVWFCPAVPTPALPPNPSLIWQLLPGLRNMPPGTFFWAPTFLLIASVPYGTTVHTLPETSSQVMPAAHCHISFSPDYSSIPLTNTWEGERGRVFGSMSCFRKQKERNCGPYCSAKTFSLLEWKKRIQGKCKKKS